MKTTVAFGWSATLLLCGAGLQAHLKARLKNAAPADAKVGEEGSLEDLLQAGRKADPGSA